jgi:hypothetical protein
MTTTTTARILSEETWRRHANKWSVITRYLSIPLIVAAIWSRVWIDWWSLLPISAVFAWVWINPRLFPVPASTDNWASKAVLGERVWLNRKTIAIPVHHSIAAQVLNLITAAGAVALLYGLCVLDPWPTAFGFAVMLVGKTWFLDRMVWLFEDMIHTSAAYRSWLY